MNQNRQIYESEKVVQNYKKLQKLFPAEQIFYTLIENKLKKHSMLDLGVGAGRTTEFFADFFDKYIGIDFSSAMIDICKKKFIHLRNADFINADVACLPEMPESDFDFILFSLNGIDYLNNLEDRINLVSKIFKILKVDGIFAFSTHNTNAIKRVYSFQWPKRNPLKLFSEFFRYKKVRKKNGPIAFYQEKQFCQLYDGGEYFGALTSYILPSYQILLLKKAGFAEIKTVDIKGNFVPYQIADTINDNWIHYICSKK